MCLLVRRAPKERAMSDAPCLCYVCRRTLTPDDCVGLCALCNTDRYGIARREGVAMSDIEDGERLLRRQPCRDLEIALGALRRGHWDIARAFVEEFQQYYETYKSLMDANTKE